MCLGRKRVGARPGNHFFAGGWDRIEGPTGALKVTADVPSRPRAESAGSSPLPTRPAQPRGASAFRFREVLPTAREVSSRAAGTAGLLPGPTERVIIMPARLKHGQRSNGQPSSQLREHHDAGDFETKTQDKLVAAS